MGHRRTRERQEARKPRDQINESIHPTGSLKHRLARATFLYALCNGRMTDGTTIVEVSSGSTAVSEAYFAPMIGVPLVAVLPKSTAASKIMLIEFYGGQIYYRDAAPQMQDASRTFARDIGGYFMDRLRIGTCPVGARWSRMLATAGSSNRRSPLTTTIPDL